jgi:RND superfamily putative drug exporter
MNDSKPRPSFLFERWPRFAHRRPRLVLGVTGVIIVALGTLWIFAGGEFGGEFSLPGTESQDLIDLLDERFPSEAGTEVTVVVKSDAGFDDPVTQDRVNSLIGAVEALPHVESADSPYGSDGAISDDGTIARIAVQYDAQDDDLPDGTGDMLLDLREEHSKDRFIVEAGGELIREAEQEPPGTSEAIGGAAAVVILLIAFGSVVAMGLPMVTALIALSCGFFTIGVGANYFSMPDFTAQFSAMIGIGVGIDYALLVVTRFREGRARGLNTEAAIVGATNTAGRSVLFAGVTVMIALLGLWAVGLPFVGWVGTAASLVVLFAVLAAIFVLPAILTVFGKHIDRWRLPFINVKAYETQTGMGYHLSRAVQRFPLLFFLSSLGVLLLLTAPVLDMRLGTSDEGNSPRSTTSRRAYDLLSEGFGPGFNGHLLVAFRIDEPAAADAVIDAAMLISATDGVETVSPPEFSDARDAALLAVVPETAPQEPETTDLVHRLRVDVDAPFEDANGEALVGGNTAVFIDVGDKIEEALPFFFVAIISLSFVLLMAVFRSLVVPVKAAVMNLLSIGASFGILVAVFQWGWLGGVLGVEREGPIESFLPMMLFSVLFGLSMDYEVFLVSRIREEYLRTGDNAESVARGLSVTTRVITAAAAIMVAVFLSFAISPDRVVKEFGIGLAVAVFLDATLVRLILVPSAMQLLGGVNWWFPSWLDRIVPRISVEAEHLRKPVGSIAPAGD